ncbi:MAG: DUF1425 domain-containing protein [Phycisphaeraceae bacterium]
MKANLFYCGLKGIAFGLILMVTGCNDPVKAPYGGQVDLLPASQYPNISIEDPILQKWLVFSPARVEPPFPQADRPVTVTQPIRNISDQGVAVQYRFEFFDANRTPIRTNTDFRLLHLPPRTELFMEATAGETTAREWRIIIRSAR